jgi:dCMP deaminase
MANNAENAENAEIRSEIKWDQRFLNLALHIAAWSEDSAMKVGAVIVHDSNVIVSTGYNGLPRSVSGLEERRHSREDFEKDHWYEHAERNAIYNAARIGVSIEKCRMYITSFPCSVCMRAIIQTGLMEVITLPPLLDHPKYGRSFEAALEMSSEAGVLVRFVDQ